FYLAQGLFNYSKVKQPIEFFADGSKEVAFNQCKLARAKLDGSAFELLTAGPNNIWGFATARDGREFLQEANDMGHPVSEFIDGTHYPTGSKEKLRPYAPQLPESTPGQPMGGTGLSGLALAEDQGSAFAAKWPDEKVFYLANPITNRIQIVTRAKDGSYQKREDFLVSSDEWFRPVSVQFGPDGCLYIADWYNKIISHNEVPRTHPDRDKTRGRIWRVKAKGGEVVRPPDLTKVSAEELVKLLDARNARVARMAWAELGDRKNHDAVPALRKLAMDGTSSKSSRLGAVFALRELEEVDFDLVLRLAKDPNADVRREAVKAVGPLALEERTCGALARESLGEEKDAGVVAALANLLRRNRFATGSMIADLARHVGPPLEGKDREAYERTFARYLIRWAMETHQMATEEMLMHHSGGLIPHDEVTLEARVLAALALPPEKSAAWLVRLLPELQRPLTSDEVAVLGGQLSQPEVAKAFAELTRNAVSRVKLLKSLLQLEPAAASDPVLREAVAKATKEMVDADASSLQLASDLARRFGLKELAPWFAVRLVSAEKPEERALVLRVLNEIKAAHAGMAASYLDDENEAVAREALIAVASGGGADAVGEIAKRWPSLSGALRQFAVNGLSSSKLSAEVFAKAVAAGGFAGFDPSVVEKLSAVLGADHPAFKELLSKVEGLLVPAIRLPGNNGAVVAAGITLDGPFTVETWIRLDEGIDNRDGLLGKRGGGPCLNFWDAKLRFWDGSRDLVIADRPVV
ncbi:MAG TPA: hypothetical protein VGE67_11190, partial [Haloferula sp.]